MQSINQSVHVLHLQWEGGCLFGFFVVFFKYTVLTIYFPCNGYMQTQSEISAQTAISSNLIN